MGARILVVDDEQAIVELLKYRLNLEGFEVFTASDGQEALQAIRVYRPDLVLLDVMLPEVDGFGVCRLLRRESQVPVIMLTARDAESDKVLGFELGADDYLTKPFSHQELVARIHALLRRSRGTETRGAPEHTAAGEVIRHGPLLIDAGKFRIELEGEPVEMTPKEFLLLKLLAANAGRVLSREVLLEQVWGLDYPGGTRTVDVHVSRLRQKLSRHYSQDLIDTVHGVGYRLREVE